MQEVSKAYEQMYLDTASQIPKNSTYSMKINYLVENPVPAIQGWKGPYILLNKNSETRLQGSFARFGINRMENDKVWGNGVSADPVALCEAGEKCSLWLMVFDLAPGVAKQIDIKIDGEEGRDSGNVRYDIENASYVYWKFFSYQ